MEHLPNIQEMLKAKIHKLEMLKGSAERVLQSTIQFLFFDSKPKYPAAGSGVLFEINDKYFIFTAAHVFADHHKGIYVISQQKAIFLEGMFYHTPMPTSGDRTDDKIDFAIIKIETNIADKLKADYKFINLIDLELGHFVDIETNYLVAGHPITRTKKVWAASILKSQPFIANLDALIRFNYEKFKFRFDSHIAVDYTGEMISIKNQNPHLAPKLEGISGSGLWHLHKNPKDFHFECKLVGIVIEQIKENDNKAIIATRIDIIILILNKLLNLNISVPKKVNNFK